MEKQEKRILGFIIACIVLAIIIAVFISPFASSFPDGLEKVAENLGFGSKASSAVDESFFPVADYEIKSINNGRWQGPAAGFLGVLIILVIFGAVYLIYKVVSKKREGIN